MRSIRKQRKHARRCSDRSTIRTVPAHAEEHNERMQRTAMFAIGVRAGTGERSMLVLHGEKAQWRHVQRTVHLSRRTLLTDCATGARSTDSIRDGSMCALRHMICTHRCL